MRREQSFALGHVRGWPSACCASIPQPKRLPLVLHTAIDVCMRFLGIDLGTSGIRVLMVDARGAPVGAVLR